jgi:hypothetical protein
MTEFTYNALGQVITDKRTLGTKVYTTSYLCLQHKYDDFGRANAERPVP